MTTALALRLHHEPARLGARRRHRLRRVALLVGRGGVGLRRAWAALSNGGVAGASRRISRASSGPESDQSPAKHARSAFTSAGDEMNLSSSPGIDSCCWTFLAPACKDIGGTRRPSRPAG